VFVKATNAVAVTGREPPEMTVAIAVAVKSLFDSPTNGKTLVANGQSVVSVKVPVAQKANAGYKVFSCKPPDCAVSDLIANPSGAPFALSISVAETGNLGKIDLDIAAAELKAIADALGPAISTAITTHYTPSQ